MSRNLRNRNHPAPNPVSSYEIAPDFFNTPDSYNEVAEYAAETYKEWREAHPYKAGMVVHYAEDARVDGKWVKVARKAFISDIFPERDSAGFRRAKYRVHVENKKGDRFAKNFIYLYPGYVQRGYKLANEPQQSS